jgi:hypothetical protein
MWRLLGFLVLASGAHAQVVELVNQAYDVPAHEYRLVMAPITSWPATMIGGFRVDQSTPIRVELIPRSALGEFVRGRNHEVLASVDGRSDGVFSHAIPRAGEYDVALVNDEDRAARVHVRVFVEYPREAEMGTYLSSARRITVILVSLALFIGIGGWAGWALIGAMRRSAQGIAD